MNKREGAILTAFTGLVIGSFDSFHQYAEELMGGPVWTHEFASEDLMKELKKRSEKDFMELNYTD